MWGRHAGRIWKKNCKINLGSGTSSWKDLWEFVAYETRKVTYRTNSRLHGTFGFNTVKQPLRWSVTGRRVQEVEVPRFLDNRHMKLLRLSARGTGRLYPTGNIPVLICYRLSRSQDHSAAARIMSMTNSSANIRYRTRYLPACSTVPQPNAPPRTPESVDKLRVKLSSPRGVPQTFKKCLKVWKFRMEGGVVSDNKNLEKLIFE